MYKIIFDDDFRKNIKKFDSARQSQILKKIDFLRNDPDHPSLRTEKLFKGTKNEIRASSMSMGLRLIWKLEDSIIYIKNVGGHDIYKQYKNKRRRKSAFRDNQ
jgi:mRNA interferase RelE/StbE